jgi:hypothetical protein
MASSGHSVMTGTMPGVFGMVRMGLLEGVMRLFVRFGRGVMVFGGGLMVFRGSFQMGMPLVGGMVCFVSFVMRRGHDLLLSLR